MRTKLKRTMAWAASCAAVTCAASTAHAQAAPSCERQITADVVALDQAFSYNRLGAINPAGTIFALRGDVVDATSGLSEAAGGTLSAGNVALDPNKRPRPLTLRANEGDCLTINFQNLLAPVRVDLEQAATREAGINISGLNLVDGIANSGTNVGINGTSFAAPGEAKIYKFYAEKGGAYLMYSSAGAVGGEGGSGTMASGLFGALNVEPRGAEWYRSQVTQADMALATTSTTAGGQPVINYAALYPAGHPKAGLPIFSMLDATGRIVHGDLNAVISGPNRGDFPAGTFLPNPVNEPNAVVPQAPGVDTRTREEPFREFTVVFHDEVTAVQAFPGFYLDPVLRHTIDGVKDGFAINYGTGGIGSEIIANRLGVGPMFECVGCKYEEFFLTAWAVGDPAMVVDVPANAGLEALAPGQVPPADAVGPKATIALYPADPSNVFHSYLNDHVRFRNVHVGSEHHIFHLHAHQWLFNADSDKSTYLDSQAVGPGSSYTYEIAFNGSGNRNQTVGDSIFHCHFYPHFAQGMWAMWRVHDTFEAGTLLGADGRPASGARALPDPEIASGTPIPGVVPLPTLAMAPLPSPVHVVSNRTLPDGTPFSSETVVSDETVNPGYPFWIPGKIGQRPPHPPLDTEFDAGLPRHIVLSGEAHAITSRLDMTKEVLVADAIEVPEDGTTLEKTAMAFHALRTHDTYAADGTPAKFVTNGQPPKPGAPYADPCVDDFGQAVGTPRTYKAANVQIDMKINKSGWHSPQARILSLWGDLAALRAGTKAPEPFFFRANTDDCITFHHSNLVPKDYALDDFQVKTPTDIIGQHIHLVKFDVTSADGSGNGWNYEDGTFSPGEVIERIDAINAGGGLLGTDGQRHALVAGALPELAAAVGGLATGAQVTLQRWYADAILNNAGEDRTLRTVFSHDHYGPSTHQQVGLYSSLVLEPKGSQWRDPETGTIFGTRADGGPTSFRADIIPTKAADSYREFLFQFADFQLAYQPGRGVDAAGNAIPDPAAAIVAPPVLEIGLPNLYAKPAVCPGGVPLPCPEAISVSDPGTYVVNYRNEPIALRVLDDRNGAPQQAAGDAGDLSLAYSSKVARVRPELNIQPKFYPPLTGGVEPRDPYTPLLRAYQGDRVQIRVQTGAHEEGHVISLNGMKWLKNPGDPASGWRDAQMMGISEHFEFLTPVEATKQVAGPSADFLYRTNTSADGQWNGAWGLLRAYRALQKNLRPLPGVAAPDQNNVSGEPGGLKKPNNVAWANFNGICPNAAPARNFDVTAVRAATALPEGRLVYNARQGGPVAAPGPLTDPNGLMYVRTSDLVTVSGRQQLRAGTPREPLVLRANAGDCINMTLRNSLPAAMTDQMGFNGLPPIVDNFNNNQILPSAKVGLHPQLLAFDVTLADGMNIGKNAKQQLANPSNRVTYKWYAGHVAANAQEIMVATPVEFGAVNLMPADPIKGGSKGLVGALIIEPQGATWIEDATARTAATVTLADRSQFREGVIVWQDDVNLVDGNGNAIPNALDANEPEDAGAKAMNYRTEPLWFRLGIDPATPASLTNDFIYSSATSNTINGGADPVTPVLAAQRGLPVRLRMLQGGGTNRNGVISVDGHNWQRQPYVAGSVPSQSIGNNPVSHQAATQEGMGAGNHFDLVINKAGGTFGIAGDYLIRNFAPDGFFGGQWGILRVTP